MNQIVATFYQFVALPDYCELRNSLQIHCNKNELKGTILLAEEGINGTVVGTREGIDALNGWIEADGRFDRCEYKESFVNTGNAPFYRMKVKIKKEIVTLGIPWISPMVKTGHYVEPDAWNDLILDPDTITVDTRNNYEHEVGSFRGAVHSKTKSFREFPKWVATNLDPQKHKKIAMFCTGGIRCEKSTSYLLDQGFQEVYHLKGGILSYLAQVPQPQSTWWGECFVFDDRVTVNHNLQNGRFSQCYACRRPIAEIDKKRPEFEIGVQCHLCFDETSLVQKERFSMRQKQIELANLRGEQHLGVDEKSFVQRQKVARHKKKITRGNLTS